MAHNAAFTAGLFVGVDRDNSRSFRVTASVFRGARAVENRRKPGPESRSLSTKISQANKCGRIGLDKNPHSPRCTRPTTDGQGVCAPDRQLLGSSRSRRCET